MIRNSKHSPKSLRLLAVYARFQHSYDLLRKSRVRLHCPPQRSSAAERQDLKLLTQLSALEDLDECTTHMATDISTSTRRLGCCHICGGRRCKKLENGEERKGVSEDSNSEEKGWYEGVSRINWSLALGREDWVENKLGVKSLTR